MADGITRPLYASEHPDGVLIALQEAERDFMRFQAMLYVAEQCAKRDGRDVLAQFISILKDGTTSIADEINRAITLESSTRMAARE